MTAPILRGSGAPQLQTQKFSYDLTRGGSYSEAWKGANLDNMTAKWNGIIFTCRKAEMEFKNDVATATFDWSSDGHTGGPGALNSRAVTQDRWECPEPRSEKDLLSHPSLISIIESNLSPTDSQLFDILLLMRQYAEKAKNQASSQSSEKIFRDALDDYLAGQSLTSPPITLYASTNFLNYWHLYANDQTHYQSSQYSLRHTTTAPNGWAVNVADFNANTIYSTNELLGEAEDPTLWNFILPRRLDYKLSAAAAAFSDVTPARANYQVGWLKSASAESTIGNTRMEIQTGFVLDQWSTDIYPVYL